MTLPLAHIRIFTSELLKHPQSTLCSSLKERDQVIISEKVQLYFLHYIHISRQHYANTVYTIYQCLHEFGHSGQNVYFFFQFLQKGKPISAFIQI